MWPLRRPPPSPRPPGPPAAPPENPGVALDVTCRVADTLGSGVPPGVPAALLLGSADGVMLGLAPTEMEAVAVGSALGVVEGVPAPDGVTAGVPRGEVVTAGVGLLDGWAATQAGTPGKLILNMRLPPRPCAMVALPPELLGSASVTVTAMLSSGCEEGELFMTVISGHTVFGLVALRHRYV